MKSRKIITLLMVALLIVSTVFSGCSNKDAQKENQEVDNNETSQDSPKTKVEKINVAFDSDITGLDPAGSNDTLTQNVFINIYSRLFKYDQELGIVPDLAAEWKYLSDLEFEVKIKEGVKFHDGTEVKAEDVKASLDRAKSSPKVKHILANVSAIEVVDDYTVVFKTESPFAPLMDNLVHASNCIIPKSYLDSGKDFSQPVGSGPYKFVSRKSDENVVLTMNENYFDESCKPDIKDIEIKIIPEGTNRTIGLETGEIDLVTILETIDYNRVKDNPDLSVVEMIANNTNQLCMNLNKAPFDNKLLRQAFNFAIDKEAVLEVAANGIGKTIDSFTPSNILGYVDNTYYEYNPEKAKELLEQSGYVQGDQKLVLMSSGEEKGRMAQVIQGNLKDIGLDITIEQYEWGAYLDVTANGEHQMCVNAWSTAPEPDRFFAQLKEEYIFDKNASAYKNPEVQALLKEGVTTLEREKREEIYNKVHTIGMDDAPWVPLYSKGLVMGSSNKIDCSKVLNPKGEVYLNQIISK